MDANVGLDLVKENINTLHRRTKIICTLGPASWSEDGLGKLIDGGETLLFEKEFSSDLVRFFILCILFVSLTKRRFQTFE